MYSQDKKDVLADGIDFIEIGSSATTPVGKLLSFYNSTPKKTEDGKQFFMYAGYQYYLITTGDNSQFLRATDKNALESKKKYDWTSVPSLQTQLEIILNYNIKQSALAVALIVKHKLPVQWTEPDRPLTNSEKRWLRAVQTVTQRIRSEYT